MDQNDTPPATPLPLPGSAPGPTFGRRTVLGGIGAAALPRTAWGIRMTTWLPVSRAFRS